MVLAVVKYFYKKHVFKYTGENTKGGFLYDYF